MKSKSNPYHSQTKHQYNNYNWEGNSNSIQFNNIIYGINKGSNVSVCYTSRMVSVWDIICMLTCDWLVGRLSVDRDRTSWRDPLRTERDLSTISVLMNTRDMYWELKCSHIGNNLVVIIHELGVWNLIHFFFQSDH